MIAQTLRDLNKSGAFTAKQLSDILDIDDSSAYRYLSGETQFRWSQLRQVLKQAPAAVQERLIADTLAGTGFVCRRLDASADVNGDGQVDTADVLDAGIDAADKVTSLLKMTRGEMAIGMRRIGRIRARAIHAATDDVIRSGLAVQKILALITVPDPSIRGHSASCS